MTDEACGAMLLISTDDQERVHVCARDPHERGRHKDYAGAEWETRCEDQPVSRAASR
jgi:hypothetical protein